MSKSLHKKKKREKKKGRQDVICRREGVFSHVSNRLSNNRLSL